MPNAERALCDSGPLVAIFDSRDGAHELCCTALKGTQESLVTTWPVLTEVFHFLELPHVREPLWEFILRGGVRLAEIAPAELVEIRRLLTKYADLPMDFADASLVVVAERLKLRKVFTLDRHFSLYRPSHIRRFEIVP